MIIIIVVIYFNIILLLLTLSYLLVLLKVYIKFVTLKRLKIFSSSLQYFLNHINLNVHIVYTCWNIMERSPLSATTKDCSSLLAPRGRAGKLQPQNVDSLASHRKVIIMLNRINLAFKKYYRCAIKKER